MISLLDCQKFDLNIESHLGKYDFPQISAFEDAYRSHSPIKWAAVSYYAPSHPHSDYNVGFLQPSSCTRMHGSALRCVRSHSRSIWNMTNLTPLSIEND